MKSGTKFRPIMLGAWGHLMVKVHDSAGHASIAWMMFGKESVYKSLYLFYGITYAPFPRGIETMQ